MVHSAEQLNAIPGGSVEPLTELIPGTILNGYFMECWWDDQGHFVPQKCDTADIATGSVY